MANNNKDLAFALVAMPSKLECVAGSEVSNSVWPFKLFPLMLQCDLSS